MLNERLHQSIEACGTEAHQDGILGFELSKP